MLLELMPLPFIKSSSSDVFCKRAVLKRFIKLSGKHQESLFFKKTWTTEASKQRLDTTSRLNEGESRGKNLFQFSGQS